MKPLAAYSNSVTSTADHTIPPDHLQFVAEQVQLLIGSFKKADVENPEVTFLALRCFSLATHGR
jgi:hypothetical protein